MDRAWWTLAKLPRPSSLPTWYLLRRVLAEEGGGGGGAVPGSMVESEVAKEPNHYLKPKKHSTGQESYGGCGFWFYSKL